MQAFKSHISINATPWTNKYMQKKQSTFTHLVHMNIQILNLLIYSKPVRLMNATSASCCQHTHSFNHTHTHTLGQTDAGGSTHSCFILAASTKRRANAQKWWTGRWNVPGRQPISVWLGTDVLPCDARTGFHWRKSRGSVHSKYKPTTTAGLTWGYY